MDNDTSTLAAPYTSFSVFYALLERLSRISRPDKIQQSHLGPVTAHGTYTHLMATLRFFHFVDTDGSPQDSLLQLAKANEAERKRRMHELLVKSYPFLLGSSSSLDLNNASIKDLREEFRKHDGTSESVAAKSASFFAAAAAYAGIPLPKVQMSGYKLPGTSENKRNPNVRERMSNDKHSSIGKGGAGDMDDSARAFSDALRDLADIFITAQNLPESRREDLARQAIRWANLLMGGK